MTTPYIIVLGNEKGGTGKSTVSMHIAVYLSRLGLKVACLDVDARQGTLSRYIENRNRFISENTQYTLPTPDIFYILNEKGDTISENKQKEKDQFQDLLHKTTPYDFLIIDTPGNDTHLAQLAHSHADTIITPINDSFIDLDMIVRLNSNDPKNLRPSVYAETIWEQKKQRLMRDKVTIDWIVMRNRLTNLYSKNKEEMHLLLQALSPRMGFRIVSGFSERVIFRELFSQGLTLLDLPDVGTKLSISHIAARQEVRALLESINLPVLHQKLEEVL